MHHNRKSIYVLIGPKGARKSYLGRLAEGELGIPFFNVEALFLALPAGQLQSDCLYRPLEDAIANHFAHHSRATIELTGASDDTDRLLNNLASDYQQRLIRVNAPLEVCLQRVAERDQAQHLPASMEMLREVYRRSAALTYSYDLIIENVNLGPDDLLKAFKSIL